MRAACAAAVAPPPPHALPPSGSHLTPRRMQDEANMLVEPVRVTDREGQLDIDTTGVCEIIWR